MKNIILVMGVVVVVFVAALLIIFSQVPEVGDIFNPPTNGGDAGGIDVKKFNSYDELKTFLTTNMGAPSTWGYNVFDGFRTTAINAPTAGAAETAQKDAATDYSTTNIQVEGVDEADIIKNDDKYIYVVSGKKIVIINAFPAETANIVSEIELQYAPTEIFVNDNRLIVFMSGYAYSILEGSAGALVEPSYYPYYYDQESIINIYDITDRSNPKLVKDLSTLGNYYDSRMIGDYVYVVLTQPVYYREDEINLPTVYYRDEVIPSKDSDIYYHATDVYYFDIPEQSYQYTLIMGINVKDDSKVPVGKVFLMGYTQNMYVSMDNIFITYSGWSGKELTSINRVAIKNGEVNYEAKGEVLGRVLNQFSMDEFNGYFRIATTTGHLARTAAQATSANHIYILDKDLKVVGKLEDLAPGESIYSARFIGEKGYLVTFRKIDPLFVLDLKEPTNPKLLGKLKIPGYSDYLHPYDEDHIIGVGKQTEAAEEGDFGWHQGVKIALFDVSDVEHPKELSTFVIGDRGTDSEALHDHKAFLFSKNKDLLVIPILLAEIDESKYPNGVSANTYGDYVWQGAYVLNINLQDGISLRGRVSHADEEEFLKSGYYYYSDARVRRSLYMEDTLYTMSDKMIKMNDLNNLNEINTIQLPYESPYEDDGIIPMPMV